MKRKIFTLRGPSALQMVKLIDSISRDENSDVTVTIYDEPLQLLAEMEKGNVDFATLPTSMDPILRYKGYRIAALTIWGGLFLCGNVGVALNDLRGRTVFTLQRGMAPEVLLRHILDKNGLTPDEDVSFDYSFPTHSGLLRAAMDGKAPLCVLPEPLLSQAIDANPDLHVVADLADEWKKVELTPLPVTALFCKSAIVGKDEEKAVTEALGQSSKWVNAHPGEAADLAARYGISPNPGTVIPSIPRSAFDVVPFEEAKVAVAHYNDVCLKAHQRR